jgi:hypothetical protein
MINSSNQSSPTIDILKEALFKFQLEKNSFTSFFRTARAKKLLANKSIGIEDLLKILVGNEAYFFHYIFE